MGNRRTFIKKLGTVAAGALAAKTGYTLGKKPSQILPHSSFFKKDPEAYWKLVRSSFHLDESLNYFNNGTMGPSPTVVEQAVVDKITSVNSNLRYGGGEDCRDALADLIGAQKTEITITHNTTEGLNIAAWGLPLKKGDEVIITSQEHVGNAMPWLNRRELDGIKVITFSPDLTHDAIIEQIKKLLSRKTRVISVPHISCTIGQVFPVKEICALARERGIFSVIDGAHGAGALNLNMQEIKPDVYVSCGHKWLLGPKGTGFAYIPEYMFDSLKPVFAGAYTDNGFDITVNPPTLNGYSNTAHRYDYGTQNSALKYGLKAAADYHLEIGAEKIENRVFALNEHLRNGLLEIDDIELLSSNELRSRSMMLGFKHKKLSYKQVASQLWKNKFRIRQVPESNVDCIRVSTHIYNNYEQIDSFIKAVSALK